jgi:SAM-dependent methyltransferase
MPPDGEVSVATRREFEDGPGFFRRFEGRFVARDLEGKEVLDLGCGHGGRTAHYLIAGNPKLIVGLEISHERVHVAAHSARQLCDDDRMSFVAGYGESLPFADCSADIVLSYDVFEHVRDLPAVLSECHRVLRPGGRLYALFPPYYGPRAHHLDFVTTLPFLHHVFPPGVLVEAANSVLEERPWLRDEPLPAPARSYQGREALPRLNGTTERDFLRIISGLGFKQVEIRLLPFAWEPGGRAKAAVRLFCRAMLGLPWPFTRDVFASTIRCVLEKHQ